jgi:hypothetical protein
MAERKGPFCGADRRNGNRPCRQPAGWHTGHEGFGRCSWHGGNAPSGVKAAETQRLEGEARAVLARLDVPAVGDPLRELQKIAGQVVAYKDVCAQVVNRLSADDVRFESTLSVEQLRSEVGMWERSLTMAVATLTSLAKLNIDERLARITEEQGRLVNQVIRNTLGELGVNCGDEAVRKVIGRQLRLVAGGEPVPAALPAGSR